MGNQCNSSLKWWTINPLIFQNIKGGYAHSPTCGINSCLPVTTSDNPQTTKPFPPVVSPFGFERPRSMSTGRVGIGWTAPLSGVLGTAQHRPTSQLSRQSCRGRLSSPDNHAATARCPSWDLQLLLRGEWRVVPPLFRLEIAVRR